MSDNIYDTRLIAQVQLMRVGSGELPQPVIMQYVGEDGKVDESRVAILTTSGYQVFEKQEIANAYAGFLTSNE